MVDARWTVRRSSEAEFDALLEAAGVDPTIEQTAAWARFDESDAARHPLGVFVAEDAAGQARAVFRATRMSDHRTHFLWLRHGPVWLDDPSAEDEDAFVQACVDALGQMAPGATHIRLDLRYERDKAVFPATMITYDHTVVVDTRVSSPELDHEGAAEEVLSRFKSRGRRDVRKAIRESGLVCADETEAGATDFAEYHAVLAETAQRDGFSAWPASVYERMLSALGPQHARLYVGRIDGAVACWAIVTMSGKRAWYFYAASRSNVAKRLVADRLLLFFATELALQGVQSVDLMGIGSDIAPSLKSLNTFKTKFSNEVREVAPVREVIVRPALYAAIAKARQIVRLLRR